FEAQGGGRGAGGGAGSPPPYTPPSVTQKIARLLGALDGYTGAPTSRQLTEAQDCSAQLQKDVAELNKLAADVPRLNKMLSDAGFVYCAIQTCPAQFRLGGGAFSPLGPSPPFRQGRGKTPAGAKAHRPTGGCSRR